ncbi:MAG TPA: 50S ribosomal protein L4 [Rhodanobacteraceae bacterium]|jgi:large subunit ribosomal protein L4|nr:50S ribosomal protein L4 [Rhodanobacteraceae bacterium]
MELNVIGASPVQVSEAIFGAAFRQDLVHQVVVAYRNAGRAGTKAQLNHTRVSGTTKKFKKQKGGGARHGDYRANIFVGGARAFAAQPRDFAQKVNRKMYRGALCSMLAELIRQDRLKVVPEFALDAPKTKTLIGKLGGIEANGRTLIVTHAVDEKLYLAARNNPKIIDVIDVDGINPVALAAADHVVITVDAVKKIEEWLA